MIKNKDEWFEDINEVKRDTIKSASPFTNIFKQIIDFTKLDTTDSLADNYLFYTDYIFFLQEDFMPYIFIWSGYIFRNINFKGKNDNDDTDIIIDEELSTNMKKSKYHCEICDITFNSSNSLSQHRRTQKHEKNK